MGFPSGAFKVSVIMGYDTTTVGELDVHESVHRNIIVKITNKMQLYRLIYYSK